MPHAENDRLAAEVEERWLEFEDGLPRIERRQPACIIRRPGGNGDNVQIDSVFAAQFRFPPATSTNRELLEMGTTQRTSMSAVALSRP
jgi:hypothetical protein